MKEYEETKNRTDDVWKFLFFANNGALLGSIIDIMISNDTVLDYTPFVLCAIGFVIGSILYLIQSIKESNKKKYVSHYFNCEKIKEWFKLPCFILSFIHLTKECCIIKNENSNSDCAYCCICLWNIFIYIVKIITIIITPISYYFFFIFLLIFWFIGFLIYNSKSNKNHYNDKSSNFSIQTSGNNVTQINSTNNNDANSAIKNHLGNAEEFFVIQNYKLFNEDINNQNTNDPYKKEMGGDKINVIQMNFNENIDQNENKPEISSIHKSNAEFY